MSTLVVVNGGIFVILSHDNEFKRLIIKEQLLLI